MFEVLRDCGALARVLPEVDRLFGVPQRADYHPEVDTGVHLLMVLDMAARLATLARRALRLPRPRPRQGHDAGRDAAAPPRATRSAASRWCAQLSQRLRVDNACRALAEVVAREHGNVHRSGEFGAAAIVAPARALRRAGAGPIASPSCCSPASAMRAAGSAATTRPIRSARACSRRCGSRTAVDATAIAAEAAARGLAGPAIGAAILAARVRAVEALPTRRGRRRAARRSTRPRDGGGDRRSAKPIGVEVTPLANASTLNSSPISCSWTSFCASTRSRTSARASSSPRPQLSRKRACDV